MSNNHFRSSPVYSTPVESSVQLPRSIFLGRALRGTPPVDSSPGDMYTQYPPWTRKSPELPPHAWSSLFPFNGSLSYPLPRKGGYPLKASLRQTKDRPDLSDLGWSSHWETHAKLSGTSDRPVSSNIDISISEHI